MVTKYPLSHLRGKAVKDLVMSKVVAPVVQNGHQFSAFRIVWRHMKNQPDDAAWLTIAHQRQVCDDMVRKAPGVHFFVSSITGTFTKSKYSSDQPASIFPGINYWIARDPDSDPLAYLIPELHNISRGAELKQIVAKMKPGNIDLFSAPLFVVLKDHNSSYVKKRLFESLQHLERPVTMLSMMPAKLTIPVESQYTHHIHEVLRALGGVGLLLHIQITEKEDT